MVTVRTATGDCDRLVLQRLDPSPTGNVFELISQDFTVEDVSSGFLPDPTCADGSRKLVVGDDGLITVTYDDNLANSSHDDGHGSRGVQGSLVGKRGGRGRHRRLHAG